MSYKNIKTLKNKVKHCLENYPHTRNSDQVKLYFN